MVDPITITYSVVNITTCVLTTAKSLSDLRDKFNNASNTITAICAESSSISASLSQIQGLLLRDATAHSLDSHFANRPELRDTFDTALTGCTIVYACLDEEIHRLSAGARDADAMTWKVRCRFIWREDTMRDLLSQLRGQQMALNLLVQMLQLESLQELKQLVRDNNQIISRLAQRSRSLRDTHPRIRVADSVFSSHRDRLVSRAPSMAASTIDQTEFDFDDAVVNSKAYRRALAAAQQRPAKSRTVSEPVEAAADTDPDVETLRIEGSKQETNEDSPDSEEDVTKEKDIEKSFTSTTTTTPTGHAVLAESPHLSERKGSIGTISTRPQACIERKPSEDSTSLGSPRPPVVKGAQPGSVPPAPWESPRANLPRVQRKPLPSGRHVLMPSASMSTLATIPTASQENIATISRVSTATTETPSIFSTGSNPATNSSISLPDTIDSASEPEDDDDNDADTLVEGLCSPSSTFLPTTTTTEPTAAELQSIRQQLSTSETVYLNKLTILRTFIEEPIARRWPSAWHTSFIALHRTTKMCHASTQYILDPLKHAAAAAAAGATTNPIVPPSFLAQLLRRWLRAAGPTYLTYFHQHPHTASAIRAHCEGTLALPSSSSSSSNSTSTSSATDDSPAAFARFVDTFAKTHSLDDLLAQPLRRLDAYVRIAERLVKVTSASASADSPAAVAADIHVRLSALRDECAAALARELHLADLRELHRRVGAMTAAAGVSGAALAEQLGCLEGGRRLVRMGPLACRVGGKGPWRGCRGVVLDNWVVFGRWEVKGCVVGGGGGSGGGGGDGGTGTGRWGRKGSGGSGGGGGNSGSGGLWVEKPLPVRGIECSISGSLRKPAKAGVMDELPRGTELYPFFVQAEGVVHLLAASTEGERRNWMDAVMSVRTSG
ncbi:ankyrin repeat protein [Diplodia corticola]|uniref:Ankyrin repeat protein n=1 Tax=Diplodia corticola TaxID=236234 RepID=A0A1J9SJJ2_9PEZI|nr:ankyrin repeat protein [Diplodia corticola]OJD40511.1 ankyrin repeat protein [Diplodia corticola]